MLDLYIQNITGSHDVADYKYVVMVDATMVAEGGIIGHKRSDGWAALVKRIAENHMEDDNDG